MNYCKKCGKKLEDGTKFCPFCGTKCDPPKRSPAVTPRQHRFSPTPPEQSASQPREVPAQEQTVSQPQLRSRPFLSRRKHRLRSRPFLSRRKHRLRSRPFLSRRKHRLRSRPSLCLRRKFRNKKLSTHLRSLRWFHPGNPCFRIKRRRERPAYSPSSLLNLRRKCSLSRSRRRRCSLNSSRRECRLSRSLRKRTHVNLF